MKRLAFALALLAAPALVAAQQTQLGYIPAYTTAGRPACDADALDRVIFDMTAKAVFYCDGASWLGVGGASSSATGDDQVRISTGPGTAAWVTLPDCDGATTAKLLYDQATNTLSCGTDQGGGGGVSDGDKGDITVSGSGTVYAVDADALAEGDIPAAIARDSETTAAVGAHEAAADPHTGYQRESEKAQANGYAGLGAGGTVPTAQLPAASTTVAGIVELATSGEGTAGLAVQGNDSRLSDARTPTAHNHAAGEITSGALAVAQGGTGAAPGAGDQVLVSDSTSGATWRALPDCDNATTSKLLYDQATNAWSCGTDQGGGGGVSDGDKGDVAVSGSGATWTVESVAGALALAGAISPAQLAADQDDWNPTGLSGATVIRVDGDASFRAIRSLAGGATGRVVVLVNVGTNNLLLPDESWTAMRGTTAGNRFAFGGDDVILYPGTSVWLMYDGTSSRWRSINRPDRIPPEAFGTRAWFPGVLSATAADWGMGSVVSGTAASCAANATVETRPMWWRCDKGTTTTGRGGAGAIGNAVLLGNSTYARWRARVRLTQLSDATDTWIYRAGFQDTATGDSTDGCYFEYTHSVNSGQWVLSCESNGTNANDVNTASAVAAATTYLLDIRVNPAGTNVEFAVNGSVVGNVTGSIPTGAGRLTGMGGTNMIATAGAAEDSHDTEFIEAVLVSANQ